MLIVKLHLLCRVPEEVEEEPGQHPLAAEPEGVVPLAQAEGGAALGDKATAAAAARGRSIFLQKRQDID